MQVPEKIAEKNDDLLIEQSLQNIEKQTKDKLNTDEALIKLLDNLRENIDLIKGLKETSNSKDETLINVAQEGITIIIELEQKIYDQNRNVAAYLKLAFNKIKSYYQSFLTSNTIPPIVQPPAAAIAKNERLYSDKLPVLFSILPSNPLRERLHAEEQVKLWLKDKISDALQLGSAISQGDCFYDAIAQGLNQKEDKEEYAVKSLRLLCDEYAKNPKNSWVEIANKKDREDHHSYLVRISFTAQELLEKEAQGLKLGTAVWGRPKIEGRIFCEQFNIKLHVIEIQEDDAVHRYLVDNNGETEDYNPQIDYSDTNIIHIVNYRNHYVPLLNSQNVNNELQQKVSISSRPANLSPYLANTSDSQLENNTNKKKHEDFIFSSIGIALTSMTMSHFTAGRDINASMHMHQPLPPVEKLPAIWNVPPRNKFFTGREELLKQMTEYFNSKEAKHLVLTAHGLGGVGKTQLTLEYVWQHYKDYQGVCWFNAESRERLLTEYVSLGQELHLFLDAEKSISLEEKAKLVKSWLEHPSRAGWLLIYDSALKQDYINNLLPVKTGKILITSRYTHWPQYQTLSIGVFSSIDAQDYMKKIIVKSKFDEEAANQLIKLLGYLPLALAQASAYIQQNSISIDKYIELYQKKHAELLAEQLLPEDEYAKSVSITWNITLDQMKKEAPESVELMYCCSHLHHEQIPESLVPHFFEGRDEAVLALQTNKAKRIAKQYSMIDVNEQKQAFTLHILVQQVIRNQLIKEKKDDNYLSKGIKALNQFYPYGKDKMVDFVLKTILKPHLEQVTNYKSTGLSLIYLADAYHALGDVKEQIRVLEEALKLCEEHLGKEHVIIAKILANLAVAYRTLDAKKKKALLLRALTIFETHYGKNHIDIAKTLASLANAYGDLGDVKEQKALLLHVLPIFEVHYGKDHVEVAIILDDLAIAYGALGDTKKQKDLLNHVLKIKEAYYGKEHVEVAATLNNLATACGALGDAKEQKELLERALVIKELYYGKEHVIVAITLGNLANAYGALGDAKEQKNLLERTLKIQEKYYGKEHVIVAKTIVSLAIVYGTLGDAKEKKLLLERGLKVIEAYYGKEHIEIVRILNNLANAYGVLGNVKEQKRLLERALKIQETYYEEDHVEVAATLNDLANTYGRLRNNEEKKLLCERALKIQEKHYGKEHVIVAITLGNLANAYGALGDGKEQTKLLERTLKIQEKHYGKEHVIVAKTLANLANANGELGNVREQEVSLNRALKTLEVYYGKEHYEVAVILFNLGICYLQQENLVEARKFIQRAYDIFIKFFGENHPFAQKAKQELDAINQQLSGSITSLQAPSINQLKKHVELCPEDWQAWLQLADQYYEQGDLEGAIRCYETVINLTSV